MPLGLYLKLNPFVLGDSKNNDPFPGHSYFIVVFNTPPAWGGNLHFNAVIFKDKLEKNVAFSKIVK